MDSSVPRKPLGTSRSSGGCISRVCESTVTQSPGACWSWSWHTGLGVMTPTLPDLTHWGRCTENALKSPLRRTHQAPTRGQVRAECPGLSHRESFWSLMRPRPPVSLRGDASSLGHMALDAGTTLRSHRCGGQLVLGPRAHAWCLHTAGEEGALKAPPPGIQRSRSHQREAEQRPPAPPFPGAQAVPREERPGPHTPTHLINTLLRDQAYLRQKPPKLKPQKQPKASLSGSGPSTDTEGRATAAGPG